MTGWDINPRVLGIVPKEAKVGPLEGFHWVTDAQYMVVPKGVAARQAGGAARPDGVHADAGAQALTYDKGYFYPGPAVKDVTLSMAPKESQDAIKEFGRPEYDKLVASNSRTTQSLAAKAQVEAFRSWDQQVGAQKTQVTGAPAVTRGRR